MVWECLTKGHIKRKGKRVRTSDYAQRNDLKNEIYLRSTNHIIDYGRVQLLQIYGYIHGTLSFIDQSTVTRLKLLVVCTSLFLVIWPCNFIVCILFLQYLHSHWVICFSIALQDRTNWTKSSEPFSSYQQKLLTYKSNTSSREVTLAVSCFIFIFLLSSPNPPSSSPKFKF